MLEVSGFSCSPLPMVLPSLQRSENQLYRLLIATPHTSKRHLERVSEYATLKCLQGLLFPEASEKSCMKVFMNWVSSEYNVITTELTQNLP